MTFRVRVVDDRGLPADLVSEYVRRAKEVLLRGERVVVGEACPECWRPVPAIDGPDTPARLLETCACGNYRRYADIKIAPIITWPSMPLAVME